jgi:hypothetical protein
MRRTWAELLAQITTSWLHQRKTATITGSCRDIGAAIARMLSSDLTAMTQTMHKFLVCRASMRPEDQRNRNPRNFDNGSNLNWRGIFLFVVYTSVVLGFFLFSRNGNYGSVDEPAPRLSYDERNRGPAPIPPSERSLQTIVARPWLRVSNEGLELEGPAFDGKGHLLFLETYGGSSISPKIYLINIQSAPDLRAAPTGPRGHRAW